MGLQGVFCPDFVPAPYILFSGYLQCKVCRLLSGYADASELNVWNGVRWASIGITAAAGGFFIYELFRYLYSATSVLPVNAKPAKHVEPLTLTEAQIPEEKEADSAAADGNVTTEKSEENLGKIENEEK